MEAPTIKSVSFKDASVEKLHIVGSKNPITKDQLTPELYLRLVKSQPSLADCFIVELSEEQESEPEVKPKTKKTNG